MRKTVQKWPDLRFCLIAVVLSVAACTDNPAQPDDNGNGGNASAVVVSSKSVRAREPGVSIPVLVSNSVSLRGLVVPLALRQVTPGSFVSSLKLSFGDRLPPDGPLKEVSFANQYLAEDGACKSNQTGGFSTINSWDTLSHAIAASPVGALFTRTRIGGSDLASGTDVTGSLILTVDVTATPGQFEIDTSCTNPANHLLFIHAEGGSSIPSFTKGTITID